MEISKFLLVFLVFGGFFHVSRMRIYPLKIITTEIEIMDTVAANRKWWDSLWQGRSSTSMDANKTNLFANIESNNNIEKTNEQKTKTCQTQTL